MNNGVFGKTMENVRKHRYQACNNWSKKELFGFRTKQSYIKIFFRKCVSYRNEKNKTKQQKQQKKQVFINEPIYLALLLLKMIKIVMYEIFGMIMWNQNI